jgi:hypothetical protein
MFGKCAECQTHNPVGIIKIRFQQRPDDQAVVVFLWGHIK